MGIKDIPFIDDLEVLIKFLSLGTF